MRDKPLNRLILTWMLVIAPIGSAQADWCRVTSGSVAFGVYDPRPSASLDATGSLTMQCNSEFSATLSLSLGRGVNASYSGGRKMTRASGGTLNYNLYADPAHSQVLGDGTGGSVTLLIRGRNTYTQAIWARITGNQPTAGVGNYADTVVATISY
jgi:spore coat protein U-like protein